MHIIQNKIIKSTMLLCLLTGLSATAYADASENMIKYRKGVMKAIAGHMGASSMIVTGKVKFNKNLKLHADALAALTKDMVAMFPEGSDFGETNAKDAVWEQPEKFKKAAKESEDAAAAFAKVVDSGDKGKSIAAFKELGKTCKACHKPFRQKK